MSFGGSGRPSSAMGRGRGEAGVAHRGKDSRRGAGGAAQPPSRQARPQQQQRQQQKKGAADQEGRVKAPRTTLPAWKERTEKTHVETHLRWLAEELEKRDAGDSANSKGEVVELEYDYLLLGDSMLERWLTTGQEMWKKAWENDEMLKDCKLFNSGIGGDRTENVLWRLQPERSFLVPQPAATNQEIRWRMRPKSVILHIGTNNLERDSAEDILAGIEKILESLFSDAAPQRVVVLGVFPRTFPGRKDSDALQERLRNLNSSLSTRYSPSSTESQSSGSSSSPSTSDGTEAPSWRSKVEFRSLDHLFVVPAPAAAGSAQPRLNERLYADHVHLNKAGYALYLPELFAILRELQAPSTSST